MVKLTAIGRDAGPCIRDSVNGRPTESSIATAASYRPSSFRTPRTLEAVSSGLKTLRVLGTISRISVNASSLNVADKQKTKNMGTAEE